MADTVQRFIDVRANCARCHTEIVLSGVKMRVHKDLNELPDTTTIVERLTALGWDLPGPVCPTCKTTNAEQEKKK